ncbi:solute:sodium symporter family transporter [candidate division KSB1 bacterium]|nr:solute:sodium symporter family transporter [candidate division KSB1 bacterium]
MQLSWLDILMFVAFFGVVVGVSMYKSRKEETSEDFFLAGRGLVWPMIGLSLIAANISTEHFVGMAGQGAGIAGMAVASYEWMAAITLVFVALFFLPKFLKSGIYTIPEYLEYRYNATARAIMAFYTMLIYVGVTIAAVIYSGGLTLQTLFGDLHNPNHLLYGVLVIGSIAALYTIWGGLKAVAWADLFLGSALIIGGFITMILGFKAVGGVNSFFEFNADKLHMILPRDHSVLPWTALVIGLWIPNFYYWGLNQYITQRTLAAKTLQQGQTGIIFAAFLKLIIPFIIIFPGIMAYQLYGSQMTGESGTDAAYPLLIRNLVGPGFRAFIFAAISGAVISSLASMLNSASTIFTMDLFKRHWKKEASQKSLIWTGRISTAIFVVIGCIIAPRLGDPRFQGIFTYIQEFQGYISPGILAVFVFGMIFKKAPAAAGVTGLILTVPVYGFLQWQFGEIAFLNRMAITFGFILLVMFIMTLVNPLHHPKTMPVREGFDMKPAPLVKILGAAVIVSTIVLYIIFW